MNKHIDLDVTIGRILYGNKNVELHWCHFRNPHHGSVHMPPSQTQLNMDGWDELWCYTSPDSDGKRVLPCYSQDDHAALGALRQFCDARLQHRTGGEPAYMMHFEFACTQWIAGVTAVTAYTKPKKMTSRRTGKTLALAICNLIELLWQEDWT